MVNKAILITTASILAMAQTGEAAQFVFGQSGAVIENTWQTREGGVTQFQLDDGAIVSLVGRSRFRVSGGEVTIAEGAVTVRSGGDELIVRFENGGDARVRGAASLTVRDGTVQGHVLQGAMTVANNGSLQNFSSGAAWRMAASAAPARVFANPAQQAPAAVASLRTQGLRAAAQNGLPVTLGFALNAIGAGGDIQQAARAVDARALAAASEALPSGSVEQLLAYSGRLAAALSSVRGGQSTGLSPSLIDTYLRYLASGGAAAQFQSSYNAILTQYLQLLSRGGVSGSFGGADLQAVNAYLTYLNSSGLLQSVLGSQQALVRDYLQYLSEGGDPAGFQLAEGIDPTLLDEYGAAISAYLAYLAQGGDIASYAGASATQIQAYLAALQDSGLLDILFEGQAAALTAYLQFLQQGGLPGDFDGFDDPSQLLPEAMLQQYTAALSVFFDYLQSGGLPSEYATLSGQLVLSYLQALADAGLLAQLPDGQGDFLARYLAYLNAGGVPDGFPELPDGISNAQKLQVVENFLAHLKADGLPSTYSEATQQALRQYFNDHVSLALQQQGRSEDHALLNTFFSYTDAGDADSFPGLPALGGTVATYATAQAINRPHAPSTAAVSTGGYTAPLVLDANGAPVYIASDVLVSEGPSVQRVAGEHTVSTRVYDGQFTHSGQGFALNDNQGLHFTTAQPLSNAPASATINYELDSATSPTFNDGASAPGTFDAAVAVKYDGLQLRMAAEGSVDMPGDALYTFTTPGGIAGIDALPVTTYATSAERMAIQQTAALTGTGRACVSGATGCELYMGATPAGAGANALVMAYGSRNGGEGSVGFAGSAGFVATTPGGGNDNGGDDGGNDDGGDTGPGGDQDVGANFDLSNVIAYHATVLDSSGTPTVNFTGYQGVAIRDDDGGIATLTEGSNLRFERRSLALLEQVGDDEVLLTRYGSGTFGRMGVDATVDADAELHLVALSDAAMVLPVSGLVTYSLAHAFAPQTNTGLTGGSIDMQMAVAFGYLPRVAVEGVLGLDVDYVFATPGGLSSVATQGTTLSGVGFQALAPLTSGTGDFCGVGGNCSVQVIGRFTGDYAGVAGYYRTVGGSNTATGVYSLTADPLNGISLDPGAGTTSGALTAAFAHSEFAPVFVDGGGSNLVSSTRTSLTLFDASFDDRGLTSLVYNDSNPSREGEVLIERGALQMADLAGEANWQLGRFTGGWLQPRGTIYGSDNGAAYALIPALANAPTSGRISYGLRAATQPVYSNEATAPGSFAGSLGVQFGVLPKVGMQGTVTMPDAVYSFQTIGGPSSPILDLYPTSNGASALSYSTTLPVNTSANGAACGAGGPCTIGVSGNIGGDAGGWASLGYIIYEEMGRTPTVSGAAVFEGGTLIPDAPQLTGTDVANQITTYASTRIGIDQRQPTTVTYETDTGAPIGYSFMPPNEEPTIGTAHLNEAGSVAGVIGWARWAGGSTGGRYFALNEIELPTNGGWHVVSGEPATNLPASGVVQYAIVGATNPTMRDGSLTPGSVSGAAAVAFGAVPTVGIDLDVSIGGNSYGIATAGGTSNPALGMTVATSGEQNMIFRDINLAVTGGGPVCQGTSACSASVTGFLAGEGASHIGLSYTFGSGDFDRQVDGGVVFQSN